MSSRPLPPEQAEYRQAARDAASRCGLVEIKTMHREAADHLTHDYFLEGVMLDGSERLVTVSVARVKDGKPCTEDTSGGEIRACGGPTPTLREVLAFVARFGGGCYSPIDSRN